MDPLDTVRKLLAKADAVDGPEWDALVDKAAQLIAKNGIDEALLLAAKPDSDAIATDIWVPVMEPFAREVSQYLLAAVADAYGIIPLVVPPSVREGCRAQGDLDTLPAGTDDDETLAGAYLVHLVGYGKDIDRWRVMFAAVMLHAAKGMMSKAGKGVLYQRRYLKGFAVGVHEQLATAEGRAKTTATRTGKPGTAVVLADRKSSVSAAFKAAHPRSKLTRGSAEGEGSRDGYRDGKAAALDGGRHVSSGARGELA